MKVNEGQFGSLEPKDRSWHYPGKARVALSGDYGAVGGGGRRLDVVAFRGSVIAARVAYVALEEGAQKVAGLPTIRTSETELRSLEERTAVLSSQKGALINEKDEVAQLTAELKAELVRFEESRKRVMEKAELLRAKASELEKHAADVLTEASAAEGELKRLRQKARVVQS